MVVGLNPVAVTETSDIVPILSRECLDIQATIECRFILKYIRDSHSKGGHTPPFLGQPLLV